MEKTLGKMFGGMAMICGALLGSAASAQAQSVSLFIYGQTVPGQVRQMVGPQVVHVTNEGGSEATGVTLTLTPSKGAKIDAAACQENHLPGGIRSYTCFVGTLASGQTADITFSISANKSGTVDVGVDAACDQGDFGTLLSIPIF